MIRVLIGLEGCDGAGKSWVASNIVAELERRYPGESVELIHRGVPEKSVLEEYATDIEDTTTRHLVFDRWHMGSPVYSPIYLGYEPMGQLGTAGFRWVEKFLEARGAVFYLVEQPYDVVKHRLETRGEDYLQPEHVQQVIDRFREVEAMSVLSGGVITPPEGDQQLLVNGIINDSALAAAECEKLHEFASYVGGPWPSVLLVGERRGGQPPFASRACFMPLKNKSGEFLWDALPDPFWRRVGVANAYEEDVGELWWRLGKPPVVALGHSASDRLIELGIEHGGVPHPQFVKRFHTRRKQEYGALIQHVAETGEAAFTWPKRSA